MCKLCVSAGHQSSDDNEFCMSTVMITRVPTMANNHKTELSLLYLYNLR